MLFRPAVEAGWKPEELSEWAHFINDATGRGNINRVPAWVELTLTGPRYEASRWGMIKEYVKSPATAARAVKNPAARETMKTLASTAGMVYLTFKAAELGGYEVNYDPNSPDFLKMRRGDEVWDVSAGLAPRIRDVLRLIMFWRNPSYGRTAKDVLSGTVTRPISPFVRTPVEAGSAAYQKSQGAEDDKIKSFFTGYPQDEQDKGWQAWSPLIFNTFWQTLSAEKSIPAALSATGKEFVGTSVNRYPKKVEGGNRKSKITLPGFKNPMAEQDRRMKALMKGPL